MSLIDFVPSFGIEYVSNDLSILPDGYIWFVNQLERQIWLDSNIKYIKHYKFINEQKKHENKRISITLKKNVHSKLLKLIKNSYHSTPSKYIESLIINI